MVQNCTVPTSFEWTKPKEKAAVLLAEDEFSDEEIAEDLGVTRRTLSYWKTIAEFTARIEEIRKRTTAKILQYAISKRTRRVRDLDNRKRLLEQVIVERAADPDHQRAPGGKTGLLVRTQKSLGSGPSAQVVEEFEVDVALLKELRELEKQAAIELGQWTEKHQVGTTGVVQIHVIEELIEDDAPREVPLDQVTTSLPPQ